VLREALEGLVDTAVRGVVPHPLLVPRRKEPDRLPLAERWVMALTGPSAAVAREPRDDPDDLIAELAAWAAAARRPSGPLRVCFRLAEPGAAEFGAVEFPEAESRTAESGTAESGMAGSGMAGSGTAGSGTAGSGTAGSGGAGEPGDDSWRVEFALQGTDDPSLYDPAAMVWAGEATSVPDAEETLLGGLGRALRLFPDIAPALDGPAPDALLLDTAGAFRFLRQAAPLLAAAGFGVLLPQWAGKAKLGMKLTTRTDDPEASSGAAAPSGFDLKGMVDFRWDLAIGDASIDEAELEELARLKTPLVRLRGQWVELDERQLEAALDFLRHPRRGRMTAAEAIRAVVHAGDDALPLTEVDAGGPLGDLLSGEADRRLTPLRPPDELDAELRPYQERGLAWLTFMNDLGLGALLADDMGLGKTISVLSLLVHERESGARPDPTLAILPMSLVGNWQREAARFTPKLRVYVHHGTGRQRGADLIEAVSGADLVLTTYGTAARDAEMLAPIEWGRVVCDEAHALKNIGTRQARALLSIPARTRIALTGTPVEIHLT
jgi:SNF2 family DNA or RNA helicase